MLSKYCCTIFALLSSFNLDIFKLDIFKLEIRGVEMSKKKVGDILVELNLITQDQLKRVFRRTKN